MTFHRPPYIITTGLLIPKKYAAITIYPFIFAKPGMSATMLRHEKIHIEQWKQGWWIGFLVKYLYYHYTVGYKENPYEKEAYAHQDDLEDEHEDINQT